MKYNEKTGEKTPENRTDEVKLSLEQLYDLQKESKGLMDRDFETNVLLKDIDVSLGLLTDMIGVIVNHMVGNGCIKEEVKKQ